MRGSSAQHGPCLALDLRGQAPPLGDARLERLRDGQAITRLDRGWELVLVQYVDRARRADEDVDDEVAVRDRRRVDRRVGRDADVERDRLAAVEPVIDVVRTVRPEMADRDRAFAKHKVAAFDRPVPLGHIAHDRATSVLYHKRLAYVLNDGTIQAGLALSDRRACLTVHYAPVA